jgi:serine/threonine-protein kinase
MPLASGATFAGYTVLRLLGCGGMGEVYLAQHPRLPRCDALKVLPAAMTADGEFRDRFTREADIAATLYHPHIVEVHDRGEFDGQLWIAMDYVNGTNAAQRMADRFPAGMPASEVLAIVTAIAEALDYAHKRGMLHRDVKPANILLTNPEDGGQRILLADFGVARQLGDPGGLTATNLTVGTVAYAAPEQLMGSEVDGRADQYALGATAVHLLTGAPPFAGSNPVAVISQHLTATPPTLSDRRPELARLDGIVATALAKNPADRFASCREFADALRACASIGDCSPEAFPLVVDYPDDAMSENHGRIGRPARPVESSVSPAWADTVQRLAPGPNTTPSASETVTVGESPPAALKRRRWTWVVGSAIGAVAVLALGLFAVGTMIGRNNDARFTPGAKPTTGVRVSAPTAAPTPSIPAVPSPGQTLDGSYRVDVDRARQTYNDTPDPQPPDVSTLWAFHTSCMPTGCVATGVMLDGNGNQGAGAKGGRPLVLDFRDGAWQSRPQTVQFPCVGPNGTAAKQTTTQVISLQPTHGALRGTMTVTVQSNECSQQGAVIQIPAVATRVSDVPAGVTVPNPRTASPPPPAATPSTPGR